MGGYASTLEDEWQDINGSVRELDRQSRDSIQQLLLERHPNVLEVYSMLAGKYLDIGTKAADFACDHHNTGLDTTVERQTLERVRHRLLLLKEWAHSVTGNDSRYDNFQPDDMTELAQVHARIVRNAFNTTMIG